MTIFMPACSCSYRLNKGTGIALVTVFFFFFVEPASYWVDGLQSEHSLFAVPAMHTVVLPVKCTMSGGHTNVTDSPLFVHGGSRTAEGFFLCCSTFTTAASSNGSACFGSNSTELLRFGALLRTELLVSTSAFSSFAYK